MTHRGTRLGFVALLAFSCCALLAACSRTLQDGSDNDTLDASLRSPDGSTTHPPMRGPDSIVEQPDANLIISPPPPPPADVPIFTASWQGDDLMIFVSSTEPLYYTTCSGTPSVAKRVGDQWLALQDDRSPPFDNSGYFLDGQYVAPSFSLGCDEVYCTDLPGKIDVGVIREYIQNGSQVAPDGSVVPSVETRALSGDLRVTLSFSRTAGCELTEAATIDTSLASQGVCCPIGAEGCSPGQGGGWAPSLPACLPAAQSFDTYYRQARDLHGCPVLVEDLSVCCGCVDAGLAPPMP